MDRTLLQGDEEQSVVSRGKEDRFLASTAEHDGFFNEFFDIEDANRAGQSDSGSDGKTLLPSSLEENEQPSAAESGQDDDLFDRVEDKQGASPSLADLGDGLEECQQTESRGEDVPVSLTEEQEKLLQSSLLTAFHHKKEQKDIHRPDTPKEGEGGEKEYASSLDEGQSLVPTGNSLVVSQTSLQDDDAFLLQEEGEDLEETDDNGVPSDLPAFMFTEEQDALLQSSLATAFSRKDEDGHVDKPEEQEESAGGDKLIEAPVGEGLASFTSAHAVPADLFLNDEEHGAHSDLKKNGSFSSSPTAENDVKKQTDSSEGADSQREEGVKTAVSPDVEAVGGREEKNFSLEPPGQLQDWEDAALLSEDWSLPEEAGTFSELKEFVRQFSGTEQETLSPALAPADFVKQVQFPPLLSPDPRKIKKKLDKIKKRERDILFQDAAHEVETEPLPPPQAQESRRFRLWMLFLLLVLFAGFFLWLFVFRNQEVFRGKNIKSDPPRLENNQQAAPEVLDGAFEKREGDGRIEKDIPEKVPEQLVAHPSAFPESESVLADQKGVGQEGQGTPSGHPGQAIFEQSTAAIPVEDFFEKRELAPKTVVGKDVSENAVTQEEGMEGQELGETEEGLARDVREENDKEKAVSQQHVVDDLSHKTAVIREKEPVEDSGVAPLAARTDREDLGGKHARESGTSVLRRDREARLSNEPETGPAKSEGKRGEQRQAVPVVDLSQDISSDIVRKGQGDVVKEVAKTGSLAQPIEQGGDLEEGRATKQGIPAVAGSGDGVPAVEAGKATGKTPGEAISFTEPVHVEQKKRPPMSPLYGTSDQTYHTVSKGDTLWKISEQYTGSGFNYPDVAKKNKIANPDLIYPHQQVKLPAKK
ncbi:MAG: LysM peptidoglycan-binding domain-containing protein [Candidatus Electrothrix sp. GW3-4]|uniref:LysM peptidoglycan-binding domain-containing protein n=1 Tax=Candidatus Electrothrix sp. GW3-4 TaxID=3126740 RepID=UPI0030D42D81